MKTDTNNTKKTEEEINLARRFFMRALTVRSEIKIRERQLGDCLETLASAGAGNYLGTRIDGSRMPSDERLCKMIMFSDRLKEEIRGLSAEYIEIQNVLNKIDGERERMVLNMKYMLGCSWEETAETLGFSVRHAIRIGKNALCEAACLIGAKNEETPLDSADFWG